MDPPSLVDAASREAEALIFAVGSGAMDVPVPTCEGWEVRDLALHVAEFCGFWTHVLCEATGRQKSAFPHPPGNEHLPEWMADRCVDLVDALVATPPDTPAWTWF
ncbi:MAG: maleylpyruvate isomerase N-terminal domain-containing protein, partial [Acidimicrobiales bacterium]|nr:maleylpyruvate isomerase N-terminal domain-containing protein [Acidimicrobiales bacterium]